MNRRSLLGVGVGLIAAAAAVAGQPATAGTQSVRHPTITFGVPQVVDPIHVYGEPDIAVNPRTGAIHVSGPQGTGVQRSIWNVSVDGGNSYRLVQNLPGNTLATGLQPTKSSLGPGGGDTEIAFDRSGRAYFSDQAGLACYTAATTPDDGTTTASSPRGCSLQGSVDRQWMAVYDPAPADRTTSAYRGRVPLIYQAYSGTTGVQIDQSTDGLDYSRVAGSFAEDAKGVPVLDQHTGDFLAPAQAAGNDLKLAVGIPDATGALTFHFHEAVSRAGRDVLFPVLTQDRARTLYLVWIDSATYQAWYSFAPARDEWSHWSAPVRLSRPPAAATNVFPWAVAGGAGVLDVAWYGTNVSLSQLGVDGPSAHAGQPWNVLFAQVANADTTAPKIAQVVASPHPMRYGDICLLGLGCITAQGNRNLADFFKVTLGADGRARIVYADASNGISQPANQDPPGDRAGAPVDSVITQQTGLNAWTGRPLAALQTAAPTNRITSATGDALFRPLGGMPLAGADIASVSLTRAGSDLLATVVTTGATLSDAATGAHTPFAEIVLRWQQGSTLWHSGLEMPAGAGPGVFFAGRTTSVDLCSVSGCQPNYLAYPMGTILSGQANTASGRSTYTWRIPAAAVGNPSAGTLLEEVAAYVTVSPASFAAPVDNARAFLDEVPLVVDGTRTFNARA